MFTLKVFHPDGSYWAIACADFKVIPATSDAVQIVEAGRHTVLFDGSVDKIFVENENGQTIDVIRQKGGRNGLV